MPGAKEFAVVRPYGRSIHKQVREMLVECELIFGGFEIKAGATDSECTRRLKHLKADLLVLPYHKHHDSKGVLVDGIGVALKLPDPWATPILMPVSSYSQLASFPIRFSRLEAERPVIHSLIHIIYERHLNNLKTREWIKAVTE